MWIFCEKSYHHSWTIHESICIIVEIAEVKLGEFTFKKIISLWKYKDYKIVTSISNTVCWYRDNVCVHNLPTGSLDLNFYYWNIAMLPCYTFLVSRFNPVFGNSFPLTVPYGQIGIAWKSKKCVDWLHSTQRCANNVYLLILNVIKLTHKYKCSHIHYSLSWEMQALINLLSLMYILIKILDDFSDFHILPTTAFQVEYNIEQNVPSW